MNMNRFHRHSKFHSIRWQLPASYAAIALLAALALGAVLLFTLRRYYTTLEQQYLNNNAASIAVLIGRSLQNDASIEEVQSQINSYAFLSQVHIDVYDAAGSLLASTPRQGNFWIMVGKPVDYDANSESVHVVAIDNADASQKNVLPMEAQPAATPIIQTVMPEAVAADIASDSTQSSIITIISKVVPNTTMIAMAQDDPVQGNIISLSNSLYGMDINGERPDSAHLSDQSITRVIIDGSGKTLGSIRLSQGPAYGSEILNTVARGWLLASALAVLLAGGVGFIVSRRITRPLSILSETTSRMAQGELDMRAGLQRKDEFGALALSFDYMAERIQDTIQTLRRFVADAAHELQTPITALHTDLELTLQELESGQNRRAAKVYLPRALTQVERLKNLSASLLDLSRLEAGERNNAYNTLDLQQLLASLSESWAARAEQAGIDFTLLNPPQPVPILGSVGQLSQALQNLLDNAIKFTPAGGNISVSLSLENRLAMIQIRDTGIGIPPEDIPQLFSRFHRGSNSAAYSGNGLGLAIVKAIAEQHGGSVSCKAAEPSPGTVFELLLPLQK